MGNQILLALWFFAPAGAANVTPILVAKIPWLQRYDQPMDAGRSWRGKRLLGDHKTWRGLVSGTIAAVLAVGLQVVLTSHSSWLQSFTQPVNYAHVDWILLGVLLGLGALLGDAVESFFKRQLAIRPGHSWFPFDQIDYVMGGAVLSAAVVRLPLETYAWVLILWTTIHLISSYLGWMWSLKDRPL